MDPAPLRELLDLISGTPGHELHSLLLVKDGKLVMEEYWPGVDLVPTSLEPVQRDFHRHNLHYVASVSKSITSALAGIALEQGFLESVDDSLFSYFPEHLDLRTEENAGITLAHLLSFSSGYDWNEFVYGFSDARDSHYQMFRAEDPVRYLLGRPMTTEPGELFHYNSGDTNLLGEIIRRASASETILDYLEEYLFDPLGVEEYTWVRFGSAPFMAFTSGGASLRPRDMAKLGLLYLGGGVWKGTRILSSEWVARSVQMAVPLEGDYRSLYGYGFNWWLGLSRFGEGMEPYFRAAGWGGQNIFVYPGLDLVLVFTAGWYYEGGPLDMGEVIEDYILRSLPE
jgi:CubicO group peptidase (beta-lactamase class C family)